MLGNEGLWRRATQLLGNAWLWHLEMDLVSCNSALEAGAKMGQWLASMVPWSLPGYSPWKWKMGALNKRSIDIGDTPIFRFYSGRKACRDHGVELV